MKFRKVLILLQTFCLVLLLSSFLNINLKAASSVGLGDVGFTEKRDIYNGVNIEYAVGYNNNEDQKAYTVEIDKDALTPFATYGEYVYGGETLSNMIKKGEADMGKKVVVAINGDFYDTSNGVSRGIMIVNGELATLGITSNGESAIGFKKDGSVIFSQSSITVSFNDGVEDHNVVYFNNDRKYDTTNLYMYNSAFGETTKSYADGKEVVLTFDEASFALGSTIKAKVTSIGTKDTVIGPNNIIIGSGNVNDSRLANLEVGKEITISIKDNNPSLGWSDVVQSIGYPHLLAIDGKPTSAIDDPAVHPRTAFGIKEDGTYVLFQVDGRQPGWSNGLTFKQMVEWMVDVKGCKTVVNLDGGGSSTIMARMPGDEDAKVLNSPSDGIERSNSNAILFFANEKADPNQEVAHLHTYPKNIAILEGAETEIKVTATDKNYYPVNLPTDVKFSTESDLFTVDSKGKLLCKNKSGEGEVIVSFGNIQDTTTVKIMDRVTKITCDKTIISVAPNEECKLNITAFNGSVPLTVSNSSFSWYLSSSTLGTIKDGVFKGSATGGTGSLIIGYKNYEVTIPIEVGKLPTMISTFEDVTIGGNWLQTIEAAGGGGKGSVSINTDERYVKFGEKSLRIDYDFRSATATTGVTAYTNGGWYKLEGYPTHLGMWVYGDGNGANIRMQIRDGNGAVQYISYSPDVATWEGWQYIEATIPSGLPTPIQIQYPIRVMSVGGKVKTSGTLYFDNLRAVYGFRNDDTLSPTLSNITPENGSTTSNNQEVVSVTINDLPDSNGITTGVKKESIKMWINDEQITNLVIVDNSDGSIKVSYNPSALTTLKPGPQICKIRVEDNYGNITIKSWQFTLSGEYAGVDGILPKNEIVFAGDTVNYYITTNSYKNFEKLTGTFNFNHKALRLASVILMDKNLTMKIDTLASANSSGKMNFTLTGMNNVEMPKDNKIIKITFKTVDGFASGSDTNLTFTDVLVYETGYDKPTKFMLPSYETKVDYHYRLSYITSTYNSPITFKVTDENLNPVEDAVFKLVDSNETLSTRTNSEGVATLNDFMSYAKGTSFKIRVEKGEYYSETITVVIRDSLGTNLPSNIFVSPGDSSDTSAYITWRTNLDTIGTVINYRKKGDSNWITDSTSGYTERVYVSLNGAHQEYLSHIVCIKDLEPGTEYEYYVGDGTSNSSAYSFKTTNDSLDIIFLGDPQNSNVAGYQITSNVIEAAFNKLPSASLVMYAGDIVDNVTLESQWDAFHSVIGKYNTNYISAAATGNHDVITNYSDPFIYSLTPNQNGVDVIGSCYSFVAGNALIAVIDTETASKFDAQAKWLKNLMLTTDKDFKIVLMHRSPYASNYDEPYIRDYWPQVFEDAGVDLVLSGHDHVYASTTMKDGKKVSVNEGVTYVVGGTSGQKYYSANNLSMRYWLDFVYDDDYPIFSTISIKDRKLSLNSYALIGGTSKLINTINLEAKKEVVKDIEVTFDNTYATTLTPLTINTKVIGESNEVISEAASISLKESVPGVKLEKNKVVIEEGFVPGTEIVLLINYKGYVKEVVVKAKIISAKDASDAIVEANQEFLNKLFK